MTRLQRLRKKSTTEKRFASKLQQNNLQLVWSQRGNSLPLNGTSLSKAQLLKAKQGQLPKPSERVAVMSNEDTEDYLICSAL